MKFGVKSLLRDRMPARDSGVTRRDDGLSLQNISTVQYR
jgi:hypothetical protein